jgi:NAD(P)-dependent dehydrogenase (short-subunit alcohol dehydrogenase family)
LDLTGRTFIITGGTGALGGAVTREFLEAGARAAVTWRSEQEWQALRSDLSHYGDTLAGFLADVTDPEDAARAVGEVRERLGPINGLIHLVGGFTFAPVEQTDPVVLDRMLDMNLRSAFLMSRAVIPRLREARGGKILLVSSRAALKGAAGLGAYSAAKAGVIRLAETLAEELQAENIQANCILPSLIDTPANRAAMPDADHSLWVPPARIARVLRFLASPDADIISGAAVPVYGRA